MLLVRLAEQLAPLSRGPGVSGISFLTFGSLRSGSKGIAWGPSTWSPAEVSGAGGAGAAAVWLGHWTWGWGAAGAPDWSAPSGFRRVLVWLGL